MSESTFERLTKKADEAQASRRRRLLLGAGAVVGAGVLGLLASVGSREIGLWTDEAPPPAQAGWSAFVKLPDLTVNLRPTSKVKLLKIGVTLRTAPDKAAELATLEPVLIDGMQDYLRQLDEHDLEGNAGLARLREGLLRRSRLLAAPVPVEDVLLRTMILQ
ncbi:flagellar basal body-associated FliL family protein [Rhodospirillum centenum]|uniref:Flagellar protein FliL n=1 Tax=Rhodospirillum centenum (strain ATCC 51521 / SW) TaxID=414684 RepID=B6IQ98_RHOCS|nr:flagellar basal body-associated FliL family protein [Rhodospirillum centenum]ACI97634.1 flagellar basal body-associated protein FliL [Rhodospirillum centenum SW]